MCPQDTDAPTYVIVDGRTDRWTDRQMDGWMDGRMDGQTRANLNAPPLSGGIKTSGNYLSKVDNTVNTILKQVSYKHYSQLFTKSKMLGLAWFPMCSKSLNPFVIAKAILVPFLSNKALVATVVPIRIHSILDASIGMSAANFFPVS